jgi:hypothetical protein
MAKSRIGAVLLLLLSTTAIIHASLVHHVQKPAGLRLDQECSNPLRLKGGGSEKGAVLLTGGAGYIGTHCIVALHEAGYDVSFGIFTHYAYLPQGHSHHIDGTMTSNQGAKQDF